MSATLPASPGTQSADNPRRDAIWSVINSPIGNITITLLVIIIIGVSWVGHSFLTGSNLNILTTNIAVPLLLATFSAFALLAGVVDLSIGSNAGLSASIFAYLVLHHWNPWPAALVVAGVGILIGVVNAAVVVGLGAPPIAATLGMLATLAGLQMVLNGTDNSLTVLVPSLYHFANRDLGPIPLVVILLIVLVVVAVYVVTMTRLGLAHPGRGRRRAGRHPGLASRCPGSGWDRCCSAAWAGRWPGSSTSASWAARPTPSAATSSSWSTPGS